MPKAPRKVCAKPGCGKIASGTFCDEHAAQRKNERKVAAIRYDEERGTAASRGYGSRWSRYSKRFREQNPLCVMCKKEGKLKVGNCVDHIIPVNGPDDPLFWEPSNHQTLCTRCHSIKTASEDGGFGNRKVRL